MRCAVFGEDMTLDANGDHQLGLDLPDIEFVLKRLLKNATDMGNITRRLYGVLRQTWLLI